MSRYAWGYNEAREVAYGWSAGSGDGLFLYSFASMGCHIYKGDDFLGDYKPLIIKEIKGDIKWCEGRKMTQVNTKNIRDLNFLLFYVQNDAPPGLFYDFRRKCWRISDADGIRDFEQKEVTENAH